ncbi:hypothetical protein D3C87_1425360 [compost metagenome]
MVSPPTFSALNLKLPFWLIVPANTLSPSFLATATGSPVIILSSTNEVPSYTTPSTGIFSPDLTKIWSAICTSATAISFSPFAVIIITVLGCKPTNFLMADEVLDLALSSSNLPSIIKTIITAAASK